MNEDTHPAAAEDRPIALPRSGPTKSLVQKLFARAVRVETVEALNSKFRLITLQGDALKDISWTPGASIDLLLGGWVRRRYTPLEFDPKAGRTHILAYLQAGGPGSRWAQSVCAGEPCFVFGPRSSFNLTKLRRPAVFFGDETTFGLARALRATAAAERGIEFFFELNTPVESIQALEALALPSSRCSIRTDHDDHLPELEMKMLELVHVHRPSQFLLSGRAAAIQRIIKILKKAGLSSSQFLTQVYWACQ